MCYLSLFCVIRYLARLLFSGFATVRAARDSETYAMQKKEDDFLCGNQKNSERGGGITAKGIQALRSQFRLDSDTDTETTSGRSFSSAAVSGEARRRLRANLLIRQFFKKEKTESMLRALRVHACTWNVDRQPPPNGNNGFYEWLLGRKLMGKVTTYWDLSKEARENSNETTPPFPIEEFPDIVIVTLQEVEMGGVVLVREYTETGVMWTEAIVDALNKISEHRVWYKKVKSVQLVGLVLVVVARVEHINYVTNVRVSLTRTGAMRGVWGNKGSVGIRATIYGKRFLFIAAHFVAHKHNERTRTLNYHASLKDLMFEMPAGVDSELDVLETFSTAARDSNMEDGIIEKRSRLTPFFRNLRRTPSALLEKEVLDKYDYVFFLGDLNSRLHGLKGTDIRRLVRNKEYDRLICHDEIRQGMISGDTFDGFQEALIAFPPTYKLDRKTDLYDTSRRKREPAWCDRILFRVCLPCEKSDDDDSNDHNVDGVNRNDGNNKQEGENRALYGSFPYLNSSTKLMYSMPEFSVPVDNVNGPLNRTDDDVVSLQSSTSSMSSEGAVSLLGKSDSVLSDMHYRSCYLETLSKMRAQNLQISSFTHRDVSLDETESLPTFLAARRSTCTDKRFKFFPMIPNKMLVFDYHHVQALRHSDHRPVCAQFRVSVLSFEKDLVDSVLQKVNEAFYLEENYPLHD
ncbi:hypothetical protein, conserved [Trypanosoma cruzi]|uniref:Inositol polyphosphate-related phosphatase domain-containing protein n=2 Tax=Trypanosoma cruzi TaxID=5693 RepID=Q4E325_TRYCC|nr:hypothetical protein, conserved [Trypanosoma cruzi]EAN99152.1 hypothetical protein, conserved [Trypanosoma cruzi]|eukprot:XP_821003.1 hypothetical protein [Trypanosoma cruzi strain CL Brener]